MPELKKYRLRVYLPNGIIISQPGGLEALREVGVLDDPYRIEARRKLEGDVIFMGSDYHKMKELDDSELRCALVYVDIEENYGTNADEWHHRDRGYIAMRDCVFNVDRCTVMCPLYLNDHYTKYEQERSVTRNFFDSPYPRYGGGTSYSGMGSTFNTRVENGLRVYDLLNWLFQETYGAMNVRSDFFQWMPDNPAYTIAYSQYLTNIQLFQISDIIRRDIVGYTPATKMDSTWEELIQTLCIMFNLRYRITATEFRIEHVSWWTRNVEFDLTTLPYSKYIDGEGKYVYDNEQYAKFEEFESADIKYIKENHELYTPQGASDPYADWIARPIVYDNECVNKLEGDARTKTHRIPYYLNASMLGRLDGTDQSLDYEGINIQTGRVYDGTLGGVNLQQWGMFTTVNQHGNALSWAHLLENFHKWERMFLVGEMNENPVVFNSAIKVRLQKNLKIPLCNGERINLLSKAISQLGTGEVKTYEYDYGTGIANITLAFEPPYNAMSQPTLLAEGFATTMNVVFNSSVALSFNDTGVVSVYAQTKFTAAGGIIEIFSNGHYQYTPPTNYVGMDSFIYYGIDSNGNNQFSRVDIGVRPTAIWVRGEGRYKEWVQDGFGNQLVDTANYVAAFYMDAACTQPVNLTGMIIFINFSGVGAGSFLAHGTEMYHSVIDWMTTMTFPTSIAPSVQYTAVANVYV